MNLKKIFYLILLIAAIGSGIGYYMYNKPVQSLENNKAEYQISAVELLGAFETSEAEANDKFLDRIISVNGLIDKINVNEHNYQNIYLQTHSPLSQVICEMEKGRNIKLKVGDKVTIKGKCTGFLMDVIMVQCINQ